MEPKYTIVGDYTIPVNKEIKACSCWVSLYCALLLLYAYVVAIHQLYTSSNSPYNKTSHLYMLQNADCCLLVWGGVFSRHYVPGRSQKQNH